MEERNRKYAAEDDSDIELPSKKMKEALNWRMCPTKSFSDWNIAVVASKQQDVPSLMPTLTTFHVHKTALALGPRSSEYFARLLLEGQFEESQESTSRIELSELTAKAFPDLLDFVYGLKDSKDFLTTENATALHWLANYFEVPLLCYETIKFVKDDLTLNTCGIYFEHAFVLKDEKVRNVTAKYCKDHILEISTDSRLVRVPDLAFWREVVAHKGDEDIERASSRHLSLLIENFFRFNSSSIADSEKAFKDLTDEDCLPAVHYRAALSFIDMERRFLGSCPPSDLTSLQNRCVSAVADNWDKPELRTKDSLSLLKRQNPAVTGAVLMRSLDAASISKQEVQMRLDKSQNDLEQSHRELVQSKQATLNAQLAARQEQAALNAELNRYRLNLQTCERNLAASKSVVDSFHPVPYEDNMSIQRDANGHAELAPDLGSPPAPSYGASTFPFGMPPLARPKRPAHALYYKN